MSDPSLDPLRRRLPSLRHWTQLRLRPCDFHGLMPEQLDQQVREASAFLEREDVPRTSLPLTTIRTSLLDWIGRVSVEAGRETGTRLPPDRQIEDDRPPLEAALGRQAVDRYERALQKLGETEREAAIARIELGLSYQAMATSRGLSASAARLAVLHAIVHLAMLMNDDEV